MSISYVEIINSASLYAEGEHEVDWRNAASCAYYAAYHRAHLSVSVCPDNSHLKMGSHERLTERFNLQKTTPAKSISYIIQAMKRQRHIADYEISGHFVKSIGINQVAQFAALEERLKAFDISHTSKTA
ncbi:hypothetical protein ABIE30_000624 [Janthinobacterium lividum]|uniref:hypothetical protein n=1 Tax=Janthinobacterium lividum TaxID=29581 RepID=UPI003D1B9E4C